MLAYLVHGFGEEGRQDCAQFDYDVYRVHLACGCRNESDHLVPDPGAGVDQQRNRFFQQIVQSNLQNMHIKQEDHFSALTALR